MRVNDPSIWPASHICPCRRAPAPHHITAYPVAWTTHYLKNHYERLDPVIARVLSNPEPFAWGLELGPAGVSGAQRQLLYEAAEFGIRAGFAVPIRDGRGPVAAVTFTANMRNTAVFRRRVDQHKRVLQLMAMYFHAHARRKLIPARTVDPRKRLDPKRPIRGADIRRHGSGPSARLAPRRDPASPPADICRE